MLDETLPAPSSPPAKEWDRRGLAVLAFAHGASDFYAGMIPLVVFYVASAHGLSPVFQGFVGFIWYATSSIVQPVIGAYSDRKGQWWFMAAALALTSLGISLAGRATDPIVLVALVVVAGFGSAILHPEGGRYAAMLSGKRRAAGISIFTIGGQIGISFGPIVAAIALGHAAQGGTFWLIVPGLAAALALFVMMRGVGARAARRHESVPAATGKADRVGITLMVSSTALRQLVSTSFSIFLPNLLIARGYSLVQAGQIVTVFLLVGAIGMYVGGNMADRYGHLRISLVTAIASVPLLIAFFLLHGISALVALVCANVMLAAMSAPAVALVQSMLPRNLGMALGLMNGVAYGAGSALVTGVGAIVASQGPAYGLFCVSWVPLVSAGAYVLVGRRLASQKALAAAGTSTNGTPPAVTLPAPEPARAT